MYNRVLQHRHLSPDEKCKYGAIYCTPTIRVVSTNLHKYCTWMFLYEVEVSFVASGRTSSIEKAKRYVGTCEGGRAVLNRKYIEEKCPNGKTSDN